MTAAKWNVVTQTNEALSLSLVWAVDGVPVNLTGYSAALQVRASAEALDSSLSLTEASGLTLGGAAGSVGVYASAAQVGALGPGVFAYDLVLTSGGGVSTALLAGDFIVRQGVSR